MPDQNIDPVLITSHIIVALQQIVSRHANPRIPSVLSFRQSHGQRGHQRDSTRVGLIAPS
jgi:metal-dependent amidase/aminoacylase/carboxypeptidase family protein